MATPKTIGQYFESNEGLLKMLSPCSLRDAVFYHSSSGNFQDRSGYYMVRGMRTGDSGDGLIMNLDIHWLGGSPSQEYVPLVDFFGDRLIALEGIYSAASSQRNSRFIARPESSVNASASQSKEKLPQ